MYFMIASGYSLSKPKEEKKKKKKKKFFNSLADVVGLPCKEI